AARTVTLNTVTDSGGTANGGVETNTNVNETATITVTPVNDAPVNTIPATAAADPSSTLTFNGVGSNPSVISTADVDGNLSEVVLVVDVGTISTGLTSGGASAVITGAGTTITITRGAGTEQDVQDILATLEYTSTAAVGDVTLTTTSTDSSGLTDVDTTTISVVGPATAATIDDLSDDTPPSTGLLRTDYSTQTIILVGDGTPGSNAPSPTFDASTIEASVDASGATPTFVTRETNGIGTGLSGRTTDYSASTNSETVTGGGENTIITYTGLIYLEAGTAYGFSGRADDSLNIVLGNTTVINTVGDSASANLNTEAVVNTTFTPTNSGYYTIEIHQANIDGNGKLFLNATVNGLDTELTTANFDLYAGVDDLLATGTPIETFDVGDSYFGIPVGIDTVGVVGTSIDISSIPILTTGSDVVTIINISAIPAGAIITDGVQTTTLGETSVAIDTTVWTIANLVITGISSTTPATHDLTVTVTTANLTGSSTAVSTPDTYTVGILEATFDTGVDAQIIRGGLNTSADELVFGSGIADTLTTTNTTGAVIQALAGNDTVTGFSGADTIFGGTGIDTINGGDGNDFIFGGLGNDNLTGGSGADTFIWQSGDTAGAGSIDTIVDFNVASGDILDFSGILTGEFDANINDYLSLSGTTLTIDIDGTGNTDGFNDHTIELTGLAATTINDLFDSGNLLIDLPQALFGTTGTDTLTGTIGDDDIFSFGLTNIGTEVVRGGPNVGGQRGLGNDRLIFQEDDTFAGTDAVGVAGQYSGGAHGGTNTGVIRVLDFTVGDVSNDANADTIVLGDLLRGSFVDANSDTLDDNTGLTQFDGTAADLVRFLHFTGDSAKPIYVDIHGRFDSALTLAEQALTNLAGDASTDHRTLFNTSTLTRGLTTGISDFLIEFRTEGGAVTFNPNGETLNTAAQLTDLINLGFLDVS
ncbi:MAG: hypothetical protein ACI9D5_002253, partial [Candidatus Endobugula sp.]